MIDYFALALTHALLLIALLRLLRRKDVDREPEPEPASQAEITENDGERSERRGPRARRRA